MHDEMNYGNLPEKDNKPTSENLQRQTIDFIIESKFSTLQDTFGISKEEFKEFIYNLFLGMNSFYRGNTSEANNFFSKALPIIEKSHDEDAIKLSKALTSFVEANSLSSKGDHYGAILCMNFSLNILQRFSFFKDQFKKEILMMEAWKDVLDAQLNLNIGDIEEADNIMGKAFAKHDELFRLLDKTNPNDYSFFVDIYSFKIDASIYFSYGSLLLLDFDKARSRIRNVVDDLEKLKFYMDKIEHTPKKNIAKVLLTLYSVMTELIEVHEVVVLKGCSLDLKQIKILKEMSEKLASARKLSQKTGEAGRSYINRIAQIDELRKNILTVCKNSSGDFGRFSGMISVIIFCVLLFLLHILSFKGFWFYLVAFILSVIGGFGLKAILFLPLFKLFFPKK